MVCALHSVVEGFADASLKQPHFSLESENVEIIFQKEKYVYIYIYVYNIYILYYIIIIYAYDCVRICMFAEMFQI